MLQPRNTLVVVKLIKPDPARKVGNIYTPTNNESYTEAFVIAVGPGNVSAMGGRPETFDLKVGQLVWVKHKKAVRGGGGLIDYADEGLPYRVGEDEFTILEQSSIIGIISDNPASALLNPKPMCDPNGCGCET